MRVCVVSSQLDGDLLQPDAWLARVHPPLRLGHKDDIYLTSYRMPGDVPEVGNVYVPWGQGTWRMVLGRDLFRIVDRHEWIPPVVAALPLIWCGNALTEVVIACDPEVVVLSHLRWGTYLANALRRYGFRGPCVTQAGQEVVRAPERPTLDLSTKVSIVLPTYNGSKYIRQSIESCLRQTYSNLELIVVDDASKDDIGKIVQEFRDPRVRYIRHEQNRGIAEGLNTGFRHASGGYLTWTSDDNYYAEQAIEAMVRFLKTYPSIDFVYAENYIVSEGQTTWKGGTVRRNEPPESLATNNYVGACFLYTRKVYETIGRYNPKTFLAEDYDYWVRVAKQFRMQRLFRRLYYYRFHEDSLTSKCAAEEVQQKVKLVKELNALR
jgi:hypothetical protein